MSRGLFSGYGRGDCLSLHNVLLCAVAAGLGNLLGGLIIGRSATYAALIGLGAAVTVVLILATARVVRGAVQGSKVDR